MDRFVHTRSPIDVICIAGGTPASIQEHLKEIYGDKVRFIFVEGFRTNAELRNIGLRESSTRFAACLDSDAFVRPGWFEPLVECQRETGAREHGKKYGVAELRYANLPCLANTNIPRQEVDFAEVHCQFVEIETALGLGIYDENLREGHDFDSGLTLRKAGKKIMLEPRSFVYLHYPLSTPSRPY